MSKEQRLRRLVLELRQLLADAEVEAVYRRLRERDRKRGRYPLYRLVRNLPSLSVRMDGAKNHGRPHVHCDVGKKKHVASVAIDNGEVLAGKLQSEQLGEVKNWVQRHKQALTHLWTEMQAGRPVEVLICELQAKEDVDFKPRRKRQPRKRRRKPT
jgi:hypothetical protein